MYWKKVSQGILNGKNMQTACRNMFILTWLTPVSQCYDNWICSSKLMTSILLLLQTLQTVPFRSRTGRTTRRHLPCPLSTTRHRPEEEARMTRRPRTTRHRRSAAPATTRTTRRPALNSCTCTSRRSSRLRLQLPREPPTETIPSVS